MRFIQLSRNPRNRFRPWVFACATWMEIIQPDTQRFTSLQIIEETCIRLLSLLRIRLREINEVGTVWQDLFRGVVVVF
jgi:hypothetical protein